MPPDIATELAALREHVAALAEAVQDLTRAQGTHLTRAELLARRGCHRNTLARLIKRGIVPQPDALDRFSRAEVLRYEEWERSGAPRHAGAQS